MTDTRLMPPAIGGEASDAAERHGGDGVGASFPTEFAAPKFSLESENSSGPEALEEAPAGEKPPKRKRAARGAERLTPLERKIGKLEAKYFDETRAAYEEEAEEVVALGRDHTDKLYSVLERTYGFVRDERFTVPKFAPYCRENGLTCTRATRKNPYLCAIRAMAPCIDPKLASKYATALRWVEAEMPEGGSVAEFLEEAGGIEACAKKARAAERGRQARPAAGARRRLAVSGVPSDLTGEVSLIVRIEGGKATFVRRAPIEAEPVSDADSANSEAPIVPPAQPGGHSGDVADESAQASAEAEEAPRRI